MPRVLRTNVFWHARDGAKVRTEYKCRVARGGRREAVQ